MRVSILSSMNNDQYYHRLLMNNLQTALKESPAVLIHGPRQCGKTTLVKMLGSEFTYYTFDDEATLAAATFDPAGFVQRLAARCILDEIQHVPELFRSIKKAIDEDRQSGRFVLTGSANLMLLPQIPDSLAGRLEILRLHPLSEVEVLNGNVNSLMGMFEGKIPPPNTVVNYADVIKKVVRGGYPVPHARADLNRSSIWYKNYVKTIIERDIKSIANIQNLQKMSQLLKLIASQSAQLINIAEISTTLGLSRSTLSHYTDLLTRIFIVDILQPYYTNARKRLIKTPKVHLTDSGLLCSLLNMSPDRLNQNPHIFGHILETFVYNELQRQSSSFEEECQFYHFRDRDGYEVDILLEDGKGRFVGIEVKAALSVRSEDFKGLKALRGTLGEKLSIGIIFYLGNHTIKFDERLFALPLSSLWS